MKDLKIAMKAHLKSNNASWQYLKKNKSNIFLIIQLDIFIKKNLVQPYFLMVKNFILKTKIFLK